MRQSMKQVALAAGLFFSLVVVGVAFANQRPITVSTSGPFIGVALGKLAKVVVKITIEPHEGNRNVRVECDGLDGGEFRGSDKQLNGVNEKSMHDFGFNLSSATYQCTATLFRVVDGKMKQFHASVELRVI